MFLWNYKLSSSKEMYQLLCTSVELNNSSRKTKQAQTGENSNSSNFLSYSSIHRTLQMPSVVLLLRPCRAPFRQHTKRPSRALCFLCLREAASPCFSRSMTASNREPTNVRIITKGFATFLTFYFCFFTVIKKITIVHINESGKLLHAL